MPALPRPDPARWLPGLILVAAGVAAYANSLGGPFLLDDTWNILRNPSLRHLGHLGAVLSPPSNLGVAGRPIYNLSFALNYAAGRGSVAGYHAVNLAIHILAALTLFGLARRTLAPRFQPATGAALAIAGLWMLHPVQTASVTYISERSESLMGLFYLLTLYCFVRHAETATASRPRLPVWATLCVACCFLGMATKEVMVTAPVLVLLYDRTFCSGSFGRALSKHTPVYAGLAASWILLEWLLRGASERGVGFGLGVSAIDYALTECRAVTHYLQLAVWPSPLIFDYDLALVHRGSEVIAPALALTAALAAALVGLWRRPAIGFLACAFFLILAPTSSVVPVAGQPLADNRLYLPLAALVALAVLALWRWARPAAAGVCLALAILFAVLTQGRNRDFASDLALWRDTVQKCPASPRAHASLGVALYRHGDPAGALAELTEAVRLRPEGTVNRLLLGNVLAAAGRPREAARQYEEVLRLDPDFAPARAALRRLPP